MARHTLPATFVLAAVLAAGAGPASPTDQVASGRERSPADHEFYRVAEPAPVPAPVATATSGSRFLPAADVAGWVKTVRGWVSGRGW